MSPSRFGSLIADLHLRSTSSQDQLLEFLERERIVVPVARIRWPRALVIEARESVPRTLPSQEERTAAQSLDQALHLWNRFDADPEEVHPLDREAPPGVSLIVSNVSGQPFEPWSSFLTNIRGENESPLYVDDAVDTYYHDWQVLLVADALEMGMRVIFDTRRSELMDLALRGNVRSLPLGVEWMEAVSFGGPRGLKLGEQWGPYYDAAARVEAVRERKLNAISRVHQGESFNLAGAELDDFNAAQKRAAQRELVAIHATREQLVAFLIYLCERWDEWSRRGRVEVAAEYKRQIALAARMVMHAHDQNFSDLAQEVGQPTGHFENTLDVVFPDWTKQAREQAELSLKHSVVARAPSADSALSLTETDVIDLLDWLDRRDLWKVHLSIEAILARQFTVSLVDQVALAKEVESISTTFEHLINVLLDEAGVSSEGTLMKKVRRFWNAAVSDVHSILGTHHGLVSTASTSRAAQLANIAALTSTGPNIEIGRILLAAVLYRNDGQHNGMASWSESELHEATRIFLTALMFSRKNLSVNPPTP